MATTLISERDVRFTPSQLRRIGRSISFWSRLTKGRTGTPAMVLLQAPTPLDGWTKHEGDLCYVVMEKYSEGFLVSFNRTNWMRWMMLPFENIKSLGLTEADKEVELQCDAGRFRFEVVYSQGQLVEQVIGKRLSRVD